MVAGRGPDRKTAEGLKVIGGSLSLAALSASRAGAAGLLPLTQKLAGGPFLRKILNKKILPRNPK